MQGIKEKTLNSNLILLIHRAERCQWGIDTFKFQSDSINTGNNLNQIAHALNFKFQSDSINTPCSKTPLKPQVTTLISVDPRNKHL